MHARLAQCPIHVLATTDTAGVAVVQLHVTKIHQRQMPWQMTKKIPSLTVSAQTVAHCCEVIRPHIQKPATSQHLRDVQSDAVFSLAMV
jgi:hypothetical protein